MTATGAEGLARIVKAWREEGEADLENNVGNKYAAFRVFAVEGASQ